MTAYVSLNDIPAGVAGDITRPINLIIEAAQFATAEDVEAGRAVCYDSNGKVKYFTGAAGETVIGAITRTAPAGSGEPAGTKIPVGRLVGVMRRGHMLVKCTNGEPKQGGFVYMYKTANGDHVVGDFSAVEDGTYTVKLPGATWGSSGVSDAKLAEMAVI